MMESDTVNLLKECDFGLKNAVNNMTEVAEKVRSRQIHAIIEQSLKQHKKLNDDVNTLLKHYSEPEKKSGRMSKAISWFTVNMKFLKTPTDTTIAWIMYDGCHAGIKSIYHCKNQYPNASGEAKDIAAQIIENEKSCMAELQKYL